MTIFRLPLVRTAAFIPKDTIEEAITIYTIYSLFESNAQRYPAKTALICDEKRISYGELGKKIDRMAHFLHEMGVRHGSTVGVLMLNGEDYVTVFYAVQKLGAVAALLNTRLKSSELVESIEAINCGFVIYDRKFKDLADCSDKKFKDLADYSFNRIDCRWLCNNGAEIKAEGFENLDWSFLPAVSPDDSAMILFTSGTSGFMKAVVHTQESLMMLCLISECSGYSFLPEDIYINYAPFYHLAGLSRLINILSKAACMVIMSKYSSEVLLRLIEKERPTKLLLIPPSMCYEIQEANRELQVDLSCVNRVETGGTIIYPDAIECLFDLFQCATLQLGYGQSECGTAIIMQLTKADYAKKPHLINSCGKTCFYSQIKITDETGHELEDGTSGEAWVKSPSLMKCYLNGGEPFVDGWMPTGDMLSRDADGYFYFVDRKRDVIKSGGEMVSSSEIESLLQSHPSVKQSAVIGVPSRRFVEEVLAVVVREAGCTVTEDELIKYSKERLANYKAPKRVLFLEELPTTSTGKINKKALKEQVLADKVT